MKLNGESGGLVEVDARNIAAMSEVTKIQTNDGETLYVKESVAEVTDMLHRSLVGLD